MAMHARKPKNLQERFDWYADAIEADPASAKGQWRQRRMPGATCVHLDLGCGKGEWTCASAKSNPDHLYIAFDNEDVCIAMSAKKAVVEDQIPNVVFALSDGDHLSDTIGDGEVDILHLNYSTPFPRAKQAPLRLTHADRLMEYRRILAPGGCIQIKTDSPMLFEWTLEQLRISGYDVTWSTRDLHAYVAEGGSSPIDASIVSGYELRTGKLGAKVHALVAVAGPAPESVSQEGIPRSLVDYLPDDLWAIDYIPYGMEPIVENLRNRRKREERKARLEARNSKGKHR